MFVLLLYCITQVHCWCLGSDASGLDYWQHEHHGFPRFRGHPFNPSFPFGAVRFICHTHISILYFIFKLLFDVKHLHFPNFLHFLLSSNLVVILKLFSAFASFTPKQLRKARKTVTECTILQKDRIFPRASIPYGTLIVSTVQTDDSSSVHCTSHGLSLVRSHHISSQLVLFFLSPSLVIVASTPVYPLLTHDILWTTRILL